MTFSKTTTQRVLQIVIGLLVIGAAIAFIAGLGTSH